MSNTEAQSLLSTIGNNAKLYLFDISSWLSARDTSLGALSALTALGEAETGVPFQAILDAAAAVYQATPADDAAAKETLPARLKTTLAKLLPPGSVEEAIRLLIPPAAVYAVSASMPSGTPTADALLTLATASDLILLDPLLSGIISANQKTSGKTDHHISEALKGIPRVLGGAGVMAMGVASGQALRGGLPTSALVSGSTVLAAHGAYLWALCKNGETWDEYVAQDSAEESCQLPDGMAESFEEFLMAMFPRAAHTQSSSQYSYCECADHPFVAADR